jgi:predicted Co/Zn/Cd cation transporter (cation efflux family)
MRERIGCRDWSGGERIFVTDWDKILNTLIIVTVILSLLNIFLGLYINSNFLVISGVIGLFFVLASCVYLSSKGGYE